jgi:hypothetical protein
MLANLLLFTNKGFCHLSSETNCQNVPQKKLQNWKFFKRKIVGPGSYPHFANDCYYVEWLELVKSNNKQPTQDC